MEKATIEQLVGELSTQEKGVDLKYQMVLAELQGWVGDGEVEEINTQHYIQIHEEDWHNAYLYALARTINDAREKIADVYAGSSDDAIKGTIVGMIGEVMGAKIFDVPFDHETHLSRANKWDIVVKGSTIDIKTNLPYGNSRAEVVVHQGKKLGDSQYYMFGRLLSNITFNLFGWLPEELLILEENKRAGKTGFWYPKDRLRIYHTVEAE